MKWKFEKRDAFSESIGFVDNNVANYNQTEIQSLVRESIQNSCDASLNNGKVNVVFKKFEIDKDVLPIDDIKERMQSCIEEASSEEEQNEINRHLDQIKQFRKIPVLEIADFNTTGMEQENIEALVKDTYKSRKKDAKSGGSKGVGKSIFYAGSAFRFFFVFTKNSKGETRAMGSTILATHHLNGEKQNPKGFLGNSNAISNYTIPYQFQRTEVGTSVFIIGLWEDYFNIDRIAMEVLRNYWLNIAENKLSVKIESQNNILELTPENIDEQLVKHFPELNKDYRMGNNKNPRPYFETYKKGKKYPVRIPNLGDCTLWIDKSDDYNGFVSRHRTSKMEIYRSAELTPGFCGVFYSEDEYGHLKAMENDKHDSWSPRNGKGQKFNSPILKAINEFILNSFHDYSGYNEEETLHSDVVDQLFSSTFGIKLKSKKAKTPTRLAHNRDRVISSYDINKITTKESGNLEYNFTINVVNDKPGQQLLFSLNTDTGSDSIPVSSFKPLSDFNFEILEDSNAVICDLKKGVNEFSVEFDYPFIVSPIVKTA